MEGRRPRCLPPRRPPLPSPPPPHELPRDRPPNWLRHSHVADNLSFTTNTSCSRPVPRPGRGQTHSEPCGPRKGVVSRAADLRSDGPGRERGRTSRATRRRRAGRRSTHPSRPSLGEIAGSVRHRDAPPHWTPSQCARARVTGLLMRPVTACWLCRCRDRLGQWHNQPEFTRSLQEVPCVQPYSSGAVS